MAQARLGRGSALALRRTPLPPVAYSRAGALTLGRPETGFVDLAYAAYAANTTGSITLLATIAQGAAVGQRIGKKAVLKSIEMHGHLQAGATCTAAQAAMLIVYDNRPTGALPAITDVLNSANSSSFNNDVNAARFRVLRRYNFVVVGNAATPTTGLEDQKIDEYVKIGLPITFAAAGTGAIGDITTGAMYLITVGDIGAGTADADFALGFRTRFTE